MPWSRPHFPQQRLKRKLRQMGWPAGWFLVLGPDAAMLSSTALGIEMGWAVGMPRPRPGFAPPRPRPFPFGPRPGPPFGQGGGRSQAGWMEEF